MGRFYEEESEETMKKIILLGLLLIFSGCREEEREEEKEIHTIEYKVYVCTYSENADIFYKDENGTMLSETDMNIDSDWIYTFEAEKGFELYLSAQKNTSSNKFLGITIRIDNVTWQSTSTDNPYGTVTLSGTL